MRISTHQMQQYALTSLLDRQTELSKTQQQVATGRKFLSPADDPPGAVAALEFTQQLESIEQYQRNIDLASSSLSVEDSALTSIQSQLQRVRELAVQAGNGAMNAEGRTALAYEVRQLQESVLALANIRDASGEYMFSGYQSQTAPYTDAGGGVFNYNGDQGQRLIDVSSSTRIIATDAGEQVFSGLPAATGGVTDIFAIIYDLATNLESNVFTPNTIADLDTAMARISDTQASVGARQNSLDAIKDLNESFKLDTQKNLSLVHDLDYAEAVSRLNQQLAGMQAAQEAFLRIQNLSLFNLLR